MKQSTLKEYLSYNLLIGIIIATAWILGNNDHEIIKWWFAIAQTLLLVLRIPDFIKKGYKHFFAEMCYYVNILGIIATSLNYDIRYLFPFFHGPILLYCIVSGDAVILHNLSRSTSFAVHCFGTIVLRKLYWTGDSTKIFALQSLYDNFVPMLVNSLLIYAGWFIPYAIYVFVYKGNSLTMAKHQLRIDSSPSAYQKCTYLSRHLALTLIALVFGILLMHNMLLDNVMVGVQIVCGIVNGSIYYHKKNIHNSHKKNDN